MIKVSKLFYFGWSHDTVFQVWSIKCVGEEEERTDFENINIGGKSNMAEINIMGIP